MIPIILDTDIGSDVDDALALVFAVNSPELDVLGVTTVSGDTRRRARIARKLLKLMGREDIPVAAGCGPTIDGRRPRMQLGISEGLDFIEAEGDELSLSEAHAVDLIIKILRASTARVTLVMIGPLTNAADALRRDPSIKEKIERLVIMGGSITPKDVLRKEGWVRWLPGFLKAAMEYNLNADPAAAGQILTSGIPIVLVPAEITYRTWLTDMERDQIRQSHLPQSAILNRMCDAFIETMTKSVSSMPVDKKMARVYLHDPLTVATAFTQKFVALQEFHLEPGRRFGIFRTLSQKNLPANALVVTDLDVNAWKCLFAERAFGVMLN